MVRAVGIKKKKKEKEGQKDVRYSQELLKRCLIKQKQDYQRSGKRKLMEKKIERSMGRSLSKVQEISWLEWFNK